MSGSNNSFLTYAATWVQVVDEALARQNIKLGQEGTVSPGSDAIAGPSSDAIAGPGLDAIAGPGLDATRNASVNAYVQAVGASHSKADLDAYLYQPLNRFVSAGGKRIRPILCLLACELFGGDPMRALNCALAIENFQSAALIHDDIADSGELRRGEPCVHVTEGVGVAINVGDLALTRAFSSIFEDPELDSDNKLELLSELNAMMLRTLEGQALDLGWARDGRWDLTPANYLEVATLKTAHYSCATPLVCGSLIAGAQAGDIETLRRFGLLAGLAFQIQDDLLNLVGNEEAQGKDFRSDITEGKRTLAVLEALTRLEASGDTELHQELVSLLSGGIQKPDELSRAVEIMEAAGAIEAAQLKAQELIEQAKDALKELTIPQDSRQLLDDLADYFISRAS